MSDAAITSIVTGVVTITTMVIGLLTLWFKVKYGVSEVSSKVDNNTDITTKAKDAAAGAAVAAVAAAETAAEQSQNGNEERVALMDKLNNHESRIGNLETQVVAMKTMIEVASKNVDSTRHEMRGHLQTLTNKLDIISSLMMKDK